MKVTVRLTRGRRPIEVAFGDSLLRRKKYFELSKDGCIRAGVFLFSLRLESITYSSSLNVPHVVKPRCKLNVKRWLYDGYKRAMHRDRQDRAKFIRKMFRFLNFKTEFEATLSRVEKVQWAQLQAKYGREKTLD